MPARSVLYPYFISSKGRTRILLWSPSETGDVFVISSDGALLVGGTRKDVERKAAGALAEIAWNESAEIDIQVFSRSLNTLRTQRASSTRTCDILLGGWNFFDDMLRTFQLGELLKKSKSSALTRIYRKVFWGCNLAAVTPPGVVYHPSWSQREIQSLKDHFRTVREELGARIPYGLGR
jgi:hypothetical protein